jgi:voltage-gated potassium channel Kch
MSRLGRSYQRFRANPASIKNATLAIIMVTVSVVVFGAVIVRIFDRQEYPTYGKALWFTLQTVTTVGYGDATPERAVGRVVAGVVMVAAIGLITVVTASITSIFIESVRSRLDVSEKSDEQARSARLESSLVEISERLERLETMLTERRVDPDGGDDDAS